MLDSNKLKEIANSWNVGKKNEYYIDKVLPKTGLNVPFGKKGSGKSTLFLHMAIHIAAGLDWLGHKTTQARVLWLNYDEPKLALSIRLNKMLNSLNISKPEDLIIFTPADDFPDETIGLQTDNAYINLCQLMSKFTPGALVVDSLRKIVTFDRQVMNVTPLYRLRKDFPETSLVPLAHAQEKGITSSELFIVEDPGSYMANSADLSRDADAYYVTMGILKKGNNSELDYICIKGVTKRYTVISKSMRANIIQNEEAMEINDGGLYLPIPRLEQQQIITILAKSPHPLSISEIVASGDTSVARSTANKYVGQLYEAEWIDVATRGDRGAMYYELTENSREHLKYLPVYQKTVELEGEITKGDWSYTKKFICSGCGLGFRSPKEKALHIVNDVCSPDIKPKEATWAKAFISKINEKDKQK